MSVKELLEKRAKAIEDARAILDTAEKEKRDATAEESAKFDAFMADADKLQGDVDREDRLAAAENSLTESRGRKTDPGNPGANPGDVTDEHRGLAMRAWAKVPQLGTPLDGGRTLAITDEEREAAQRSGLDLNQKSINIRLCHKAPQTKQEALEARAQGIGTGGAGLFTVPDEAMRALEVSMLAFGGMRGVSTILRTATGADLPIPTVNDTAQKGVILAENTAAAEQDVTFAQIVLKAFKYSSKMIKVSVELLQDSAVNIPQFLGAALGERLGRILADHFTTGVGTTEPKGVVVAASSGVTAAGTTTVTWDELIELEHSVDPAYRQGASYMFNDKTAKVLRKLKDGDGRYLWQPSVVSGRPDSLSGYSVAINQSVADLATGSKSVLFGAFAKYLIRDVVDVTLLRLDERFAEAHQVAFLAFSRHDGNLLDAGTDPVKFITQA